MKNHVLRPLFAAMALVALILTARALMVPSDFGVHGKSFTYNFYRAGAVTDWKNFPVSYRGGASCGECHDENAESIAASGHRIIQCENCHGPARNHPEDPETLTIDRSRDLCLRCHAGLPYPGSLRSEIPAIDPGEHNPGEQCAECHNPHNPNLEDME
ncbi:MAG TPA: cytochrome C [Desulfobulbus sp.]|nr:cytochrome C [Desulfobulbus sp.]